MKNITFFPTFHEYQAYIHEEIVRTPIFQYNPFYRGLIDFIIDQRAPLFFEATQPYEYSHFTQYFNFVLIRTDYRNNLVRDMFFMHDFVHMVFDNPLNVKDHTFEYFCEIVNNNEWVASNETETLTYYRLPELRKHSLEYTIMYDLLRHSGYHDQPDNAFMLDLRKRIVFQEQDGGLGGHPDATKVFSYLRKFKENNALWCKLWYQNFPVIPHQYFKKRLCLPLETYDQFILDYKSPVDKRVNELRYQNNVLLNIQSAFSMLGETNVPETFMECEDAVKLLEGKIIMESTAKEFHDLYLKNKNK